MKEGIDRVAETPNGMEDRKNHVHGYPHPIEGEKMLSWQRSYRDVCENKRNRRMACSELMMRWKNMIEKFGHRSSDRLATKK